MWRRSSGAGLTGLWKLEIDWGVLTGGIGALLVWVTALGHGSGARDTPIPPVSRRAIQTVSHQKGNVEKHYLRIHLGQQKPTVFWMGWPVFS